MIRIISVLSDASPASWLWVVLSLVGEGGALVAVLSNKSAEDTLRAIKRWMMLCPYGAPLVVGVIFVRQQLSDFLVLVLGLGVFILNATIVAIIGARRSRRFTARESGDEHV